MSGYIYLLQGKSDIENKESIYKLGRMAQGGSLAILEMCSLGTNLLLLLPCDKCQIMEVYLLSVFKKAFTSKRSGGYFEGDIFLMMNLIYSIIQIKSCRSPCTILINDSYSVLDIKGENNRLNYDIKKDIDNSLIEDNSKGESVDEVTCNHLRKQIKEMEEHHNSIVGEHMLHIKHLQDENKGINEIMTDFKTSYNKNEALINKLKGKERELLSENTKKQETIDGLKNTLGMVEFKNKELEKDILDHILKENKNRITNLRLIDKIGTFEARLKKIMVIEKLQKSILIYSLFLNIYYSPHYPINWFIFTIGGLTMIY
tara:strand:- start:50 stop:997 length:948 start_codon:yes stop_codon:yes gene_type:complete